LETTEAGLILAFLFYPVLADTSQTHFLAEISKAMNLKLSMHCAPETVRYVDASKILNNALLNILIRLQYK
jgi:hypothetical protein